MLKDKIQNGKTRQMVEYLERDIITGKLKADDKIPSVRDLMTIFKLSKGTVSRGIDYLCNEGFLEKRIGSGTYVRKSKSLAVSSRKNALTIFSYQDYEQLSSGLSMFSQIILGIRDAANLKNTSISLIHGMGENPYFIPPEQLNYANQNSIGMVFIGEYDSFYDDLEIKVPSVGAFMENTFGGKLSLINLDAWDAALKAISYFKKNKIKFVTIVMNNQPVFAYRARIFEMLWKDAGGKFTTKFEDGNYDLPESEGYFFASDSIAQNFSSIYNKQTGKLLYQEKCVYSIEGKRFLVPDFQHFPSYTIDWKYMGKFIFEEISYRIENLGAPARRINVQGHFIEKEE